MLQPGSAAKLAADMKTLSHEQALAVLRVLTGLLVLPHGVRKLLGGPVTMLGKSMVKAGFPDWFAWVVTAGELCGAALALGLLTRLAGAAVALTMAGILVFVNLANLTQIGTGKGAGTELSLLIGVGAAIFALLPPGCYSLDSRLKTRT